MISALSETNEAILHAETRDKLFQLVCHAAVLGGKFSGSGIALPDARGKFLSFIATAGTIGEYLRDLELPLDFALSEVNTMTTNAFEKGQPCVNNDCQVETLIDNAHRHAVQEVGTHSAAVLPLISHGQTIGVLLFLSAERNTFTPAFVEILRRLSGNVSFALENLVRIAEKEQADERIKHLATHDSLTDLPNRMMFNQLLEYSIKTASRYERRCAVLFIDLDRFKLINDSLGHDAGDILLIEMANRLRGTLRTSDVVARLGGDEFVVLLNEITDIQQVKTVAGHLLSALSKSMELSGQECRVTASIGVAMYPDDGTDEQTLTKRADIAMYLAKAEGKNDVRFFSHEISTQSLDRLTIETDLQHALERNELCLYYQPKLDVRTNKISGVEALLRWNHPTLGLLPPVQFISVAEETGLIVPIGRWVMKTACAQAVAWQRQGLPLMSMAVNVSPRQFSDENLLRDIEDALAVSGLDPKCLQIEITESMVMLNVERAIRVLDSIQSRGVHLAIDDFGTGYSSMSVLKRFPIDTIKIDRSFVRDLPKNSEDKAIAQAIISMGKALGLTVVAEGVETVEQDQFLRLHACDEIQGFLFSKPVPADQIEGIVLKARLTT
jgi:diguanylate cyclase (GGDEF)-like protein